MIENIKLGVIGLGKMANAILKGNLNNNYINPKNVLIYDINENVINNMAQNYGFTIQKSIEELVKNSDVIFLATKPFVVNDVLSEIKKSYKNQLILSILAGVKIEKYLSVLNNAKIIRIMPNTPALVNEGMSAICPNNNTSVEETNFAYNFMNNCGKVIQTTEDKMDIITALSGSGPAYYFKIIDLMAKSASKLGLDYKEALILSAQTALGSAKMIFENDFNVEQLILNVTTKGGCTEVGNKVLADSDIEKILDKVIEDTMLKAKSLG